MKKTGFTLIELLIVIAIILILIAIALPNFLEAQVRARVARVEADLRSVSTALHSYFLDFGIFPADHDPSEYSIEENGLYQITTPIAYIQLVPIDVFNTASGSVTGSDEFEFEMASTGVSPRTLAFGFVTPLFNIHAFSVFSHGPDKDDDFTDNDQWPFPDNTSLCGDSFITSYSPTNGTKSSGEILEFGGEYRNGRYCLDGIPIIGKGNDFTGTPPR